ncbi:probable polygalacturonase At3g15720 [Quercus lobata]|uniref:probable polygalacturonase At3g15720 n=1 Tax=Quercus lobata TaxID=97700 RepID=UPI001247715F|nr:probable polygalacturonase At3g15720 [Quercus lobata]
MGWDMYAKVSKECQMSNTGTTPQMKYRISLELLSIVLVLSIFPTGLGHGLVNEASEGFNETCKDAVGDVTCYGAIGDGETDDSEAFLKAWKALCEVEAASDIPMLIVPMEKIFLLKPVTFEGPCKSDSVQVQVLGTILAPNSTEGWTNCYANTWLGFWNVSNLIVNGSGEINGSGSIWWKNFSVQGNARCYKPTALHFYNCSNLQHSGLTHLDSPRNHISIKFCDNATLSYLNISAPESSPNTDGVDISSSTNVSIHDSYIGTGDDCIAVNDKTTGINITRIVCGPGHGISVGSLGANRASATVEEVYVKNCSFNGTLNGARIKTWQGGSGYARNIFFEQITLVDVKNPIIIDQFYCNGKHNCKNETSSVQVSNVTYIGIEGTCVGLDAITFNCDEIMCTNITMKHINITSSDPEKSVVASCENAKGNSECTIPKVPCLTIDECDNQK